MVEMRIEDYLNRLDDRLIDIYERLGTIDDSIGNNNDRLSAIYNKIDEILKVFKLLANRS